MILGNSFARLVLSRTSVNFGRRLSTLQSSESSSLVIRSTPQPGVTVLRLNRARARNALSLEMLNRFQECLNDIEKDSEIAVVVLESSGEVFCSGHDLRELNEIATKLAKNPKEVAEKFEEIFTKCSNVMRSIVNLKQPVIAKVQGVATAAGCQLVASCDLALASQKATFATPGVNIGLFCSTPMVALCRNIGSKHAMRMLLTGEPIDCATAVRYGLVNESITHELLDQETTKLAMQIAGKSRTTLRIGKKTFYEQREMKLHEAYDYASKVMTTNLLTSDAGEGVCAFVEKRKPQWKHE